MDGFSDHLICRHTFEMQDLMELYPPDVYDTNKKIVHSIACPTQCTYSGQLVFSQWCAMQLPRRHVAGGTPK